MEDEEKNEGTKSEKQWHKGVSVLQKKALIGLSNSVCNHLHPQTFPTLELGRLCPTILVIFLNQQSENHGHFMQRLAGVCQSEKVPGCEAMNHSNSVHMFCLSELRVCVFVFVSLCVSVSVSGDG